MTGRLYGIGVGPGDPDLITLKAWRLLTNAAVIAYPAPEQGDSLARRIVAPHIDGSQIEIAIRMPITAERFPAQEVYDRAARELAGHLNAGRDVVVLCEGDPFLYGSFMYLFVRMMKDFDVEVVPGVSSVNACAAVLGAPLVARNDVLTLIPAPLPEADLERRLEQTDAAAIMKIGRHFPKVHRVLRRLGLLDRSRYVEHATMADQAVLPLADVVADRVPYFSMILMHRRGEAWR